MKNRAKWSWLCLAGIMAGVIGCSGGAELPEGTYGRVKGRITLDGSPIPEGTTVVFQHIKEGHIATGVVKQDGVYSLRFRDGQKIKTGLYQISFKPAGGIAGSREGDVNSADYEKMMMESSKEEEEKPPFPARYLSGNSSGEEFEVEEGDNECNVDIKNAA